MQKESQLVKNNMRMYGWVKMFTKRVYMPLVAVYLVEVGHVTIAELGLLAGLSAVCSLAANIPTGYLADKWTRKGTMMVGAASIFVSTGLYVLFPSFIGAVVATIFEAFGYACIQGASEALVHDTLAAENRTHEYSRMAGRAQSFGLIGNMILLGIVPMTYAIDKRLPFICGMVAGMLFMGVLSRLQEPPRPAHHAAEAHNLWQVLRKFVTRRTVMFFAALGLISGMYFAYSPLINVELTNLGLNPAFLGWAFAASSLVGAISGRYVHYFMKWPLLWYSFFDIAMGTGFLLVVGITQNMWVGVIGLVINVGFWRVRAIIYQDHLLRCFHHHAHKATLISVISFFDGITAWMPPLFSAIVAWYGFQTGFIGIGLAMAIVLSIGFTVGVRLLEQGEEAPESRSF